jgi:tRNA1(Val) A37 N6-methylase TrmN6
MPVGASVIEAKHGYQFGPENLTLPWVLDQLGSLGHLDDVSGGVIELGAGSGSLGLLASYSLDATHLICVERQGSQCDRMRRTFEAFSSIDPHRTLQVVEGDLRDTDTLTSLDNLRATLGQSGGSTSLVVMNPPFFPVGWGRESDSSEVHLSTHAVMGDLSDFLRTAHQLMKPSGVSLTLYDARRLGDVISALAREELSLIGLWGTPDLRSGRGREANRVWVAASRQGGAPVGWLS